MKKIFILLLVISSTIVSANAQTRQHKVVFEITSGDTTEQLTTLRQINNVVKDVPGITVELVCHGPAIFLLVKDKSVAIAAMQELKDKYNVSFAACANSMKKNKLDNSMLVPVATVVPNGVMEVVTKQEEGWSYIKAGH